MANKVGFLDLPPELRNRIYHYALVHRDRLYLWWHGELLEHDRSKLRIALLRTCKLVHKEATPVFYGSNTFADGDPTAYSSWLPMIGSSKRFLRNVRVVRHTQKDARKSLTRLKSAPALEVIEMSSCGFDKRPEFAAKTLTPLVRAFHKIRKSTDKPQAIDMVRFTKWGGNKSIIDQDFTDKVRDLLEKVL